MKDFDQASWWYLDGEETVGPVNQAELRRLAAAGKLEPQSLVWREDYGEDWRTLEQSGVTGSQSSMDRLKVSDRWKKTFKRIEAIDQSPGTDVWGNTRRRAYPFSWLGLIFGPLYYLYLRMWQRALAIVALVFLLGVGEEICELLFTVPAWLARAIGYLPVILCGRSAKYDYYRFKVHGETMWAWKLFKPLENIYVAGAVTMGAFFVLMIVPLADGRDDVLADVGGVWATNGLTVALDLDGSSKTMTVNGRTAAVTIKKADSTEGVVVLSPSANPNRLVTVRQLWTDDQHKRFKLAIDFAGTPVTLDYVRALGVDQKQGGSAQRSVSYTMPTSGTRVTRTANGFTVAPPPRQPVEASENEAGISGSYCTTGKMILEQQTFNLRAQNIPVDAALDAIVNENNSDYQAFMMESIRTVYSDPDVMREALNNGNWMRACIKAVRGF